MNRDLTLQRSTTPVVGPAESIDDKLVSVTPPFIQPKRRRGRPRKNSVTKKVTKKTEEKVEKELRKRRENIEDETMEDTALPIQLVVIFQSKKLYAYRRMKLRYGKDKSSLLLRLSKKSLKTKSWEMSPLLSNLYCHFY